MDATPKQPAEPPVAIDETVVVDPVDLGPDDDDETFVDDTARQVAESLPGFQDYMREIRSELY